MIFIGQRTPNCRLRSGRQTWHYKKRRNFRQGVDTPRVALAFLRLISAALAEMLYFGLAFWRMASN